MTGEPVVTLSAPAEGWRGILEPQSWQSSTQAPFPSGVHSLKISAGVQRLGRPRPRAASCFL